MHVGSKADLWDCFPTRLGHKDCGPVRLGHKDVLKTAGKAI